MLDDIVPPVPLHGRKHYEGGVAERLKSMCIHVHSSVPFAKLDLSSFYTSNEVVAQTLRSRRFKVITLLYLILTERARSRDTLLRHSS